MLSLDDLVPTAGAKGHPVITEDQSEVVAFLELPATHGGRPVERVDTHASIVFLTGEHAWKLKRAVRYDYLDFSTLDRRRAMCEAEVGINRRAAPSLYRGVVPVTRDATGRMALGGRGPAVEWLVEMVRFDQEGLFDRLASRQALDLALMSPLASAIAHFHRAAAHRSDHGGAAGMQWVIDGNDGGLREFGRSVLDADLCERLTRHSRAALERAAPLLDRRRGAGFVRQCHGDLHLRNIVLLDGRPTLFDAIEFNDEIACIDVFYDLAFLIMDLWHRQLIAHANRLLNAYLAETEDFDGLELLPLFLSCRAAVSAKTRVTAAALRHGDDDRRALQADARDCLRMAVSFLSPVTPRLIAIGGFSGSGKSTVAMRLAPAIGSTPGAVVVRSDEIRKQMFHVDSAVRLGAAAYTREVSRAVYEILADRVERALRRGQSVIVDAVFADAGDRTAIENVATLRGVPFSGIWLDAPCNVLARRVERRLNDVSDADARVVSAQRGSGTGPIRWHKVGASGLIDDVVAAAREIVSRASVALLHG